MSTGSVKLTHPATSQLPASGHPSPASQEPPRLSVGRDFGLEAHSEYENPVFIQKEFTKVHEMITALGVRVHSDLQTAKGDFNQRLSDTEHRLEGKLSDTERRLEGKIVQSEKRVTNQVTLLAVNMENEMGQLKDDVGTLKDDVGTLKDDMGMLKDDVGKLKDDVGKLKDDVTQIKQMLSQLIQPTTPAISVVPPPFPSHPIAGPSIPRIRRPSATGSTISGDESDSGSHQGRKLAPLSRLSRTLRNVASQLSIRSKASKRSLGEDQSQPQ